MKARLVAFVLAAAMLLCAAAPAMAIDFRIKGRWVGLFEYGQNNKFSRGGKLVGNRNQYNDIDEFGAQQRWRLQLDAVASENLSGTVFLEISLLRWGQASTGGAPGAGATNQVKVKNAYVDCTVPNGDIKVRMGLQRIALPGAVSQSRVMGADAAAVNVNWRITDNVGLNFFWMRPYNDNFAGEDESGTRSGFMDNMDLFGLSLPLSFEGLTLTRWTLVGGMGPNTLRTGYGESDDCYGRKTQTYFENCFLPLGVGIKEKSLSDYATIVWAGLALDFTYFDPLRMAFDLNYGSFRQSDSSASRSGWLAALLVEYALDWGTPGLVAWYSSGDDANPGNGSERMPTMQRDESGGECFSPCAFNGGRPGTLRDSMIDHSTSGTWGVGLRARGRHRLQLRALGELHHWRRLLLHGLVARQGRLGQEHHERRGRHRGRLMERFCRLHPRILIRQIPQTSGTRPERHGPKTRDRTLPV